METAKQQVNMEVSSCI